MRAYKVLTINPGSTSTKVALFEGDRCLYSRNASHEANKLGKLKTLPEQLPYHRDTILRLLKEAGISLEDVDVLAGRGGGLLAVGGGTYGVTDLMLKHTRTCTNGVIYPAALGSQLAHEFAETYGAKAMVVNPPDAGEFQELARMTGIKGVYRIIHLHALNLKETAVCHSRNVMDRVYEECNYVVCHIGGGISVSAHCRGKMIDGCGIAGGKGPMALTRYESISVANLLEYTETSGLGVADVRKLCTRIGGFVNHMGISDVIELTDRVASGDRYAEMLWDSMIYQIEKCIDSMATTPHEQVDGILLGGGMVHNQDLVKQTIDACSFVVPVTAYPREFEMEAMAAGAIRVLEGGEELKTYTGKPVWDSFGWERQIWKKKG